MITLSPLRYIALATLIVVMALSFQNCGDISVVSTGLNSIVDIDDPDITELPIVSVEAVEVQTFDGAPFHEMASTEDGTLYFVTDSAGTNQINYGFTRDGGETFTLRTIAQNNYMAARQIFVRNNKVFIATSFQVYESTNLGQSFNLIAEGFSGHYSVGDLYVSPNEDILVSAYESIFYIQNGSNSVTQSFQFPGNPAQTSYGKFFIDQESETNFSGTLGSNANNPGTHNFTFSNNLMTFVPLNLTAISNFFVLAGRVEHNGQYILGGNGTSRLFTSDLNYQNIQPIPRDSAIGNVFDILKDTDNVIYVGSSESYYYSLDGQNYLPINIDTTCGRTMIKDIHETQGGEVYAIVQCVDIPTSLVLNQSTLYRINKIREVAND